MKRFYKDEQGSSLVLTIVAMAFISLLAVAVISMTVTNIRLKIAQKSSQKNFYNTDSIMDEVRAGVEDLAAQAAVDAYMEAFSNYNESLTGTSVSLTDKYEKKFLEEMIKLVSGNERHYGDSDLLYKDEVLKNYLIARAGASADRYIPHKGTADTAPGVLIDGKSYGYMTMEGSTLLLKDVMVTMTEGNKDYKTTLTADIRVTVPPMTADAYSEYLNYALIADNHIITNADASVEGSMYAGTVKRFQSGVSSVADPETGLLIHDGAKLDVKADNIVTRGDLVVNGGSSFTLSGLNGSIANLWAENIFTSGNAKNTMTLSNTICNVADDMEIDGKNDDVTITGEYMGYNYNENYSDAEINTVTNKSQYSSAILINGMGANLDLSGLSTLVLSGKTFISKKTDPLEKDYRSGTAKDIVNPDIAMGESLSVKGSQIAYYVPTDFVTIKNNVSSAWDPVANHDDPSKKEYTFRYASDLTTEYVFDYGGYLKYLYGLDPQTATDADLSNKAAGNPLDLWYYLDSSKPLETYYRHNTAVQTDAVTYFYLNFKSDTEMMEFYPVFQQMIPRYSTVKDVNAAYLGSTGIKINNSTSIYAVSGNVLYKDPSSSDIKLQMGNESPMLDSQTLQRFARERSQIYMSMQLSLVENYELATQTIAANQYRLLNEDVNLSKAGTADNTNLYNVLIDVDEMNSRTDIARDIDGDNDGVIVIEPRKQNYTWNGTEQSYFGGLNKGIIISAGDVTLEKNFSGLIIAGGDIKLAASGIKISSDSALLEKMFTEDKVKATPLFYHLFSQYFQKVVNSAIGQEDDATQDVVFYERWKKE